MLICKRMKCFLLVSDTNEYSYDIISCRPSKRRLIDSTNIHTPHKGIVDPWIHNISLARAIKHFNKCMRLRPTDDLAIKLELEPQRGRQNVICYGCVPPGERNAVVNKSYAFINCHLHHRLCRFAR